MVNAKTQSNLTSQWLWLATVILLFAGAVLYINPFREYALADDWAYALMVKNLLQTGQYELHPWAAANMPFQIAWGAMFASILGPSLSSLHVSTWVFMSVGAAAFYGLACEHGLSAFDSALLTLLLISSPIVLEFSASFMTDVPYLAWLCIAQYFFTRGIRKHSYLQMTLGGLAGGAAVLTRQFGVALLAALLVTWLVQKDKRQTVGLFIVGAVFPLIASAGQVYIGLAQPNWTGVIRSSQQAEYLTNIAHLPIEWLWRLTVIAEYLALFTIPILIPVFASFAEEVRRSRGQKMLVGHARFRFLLFAGLLISFMIVATLGAFVLHRPGVLPIIPWNLDVIATWPSPIRGALTLIVLVGGALLTREIIIRYTTWKDIPQHEQLLDAVAVMSIGVQLTFFQFGDEYVIVNIPFVLIVLGRSLSNHFQRLRWPIAAAGLVMLAICAFWARATIDKIATEWAAADELVKSGTAADQIFTQSWEWNSYMGAFDAYLQKENPPAERHSLNSYFDRWLPDRRLTAEYLVGPLADTDDLQDWIVVEQRSYLDVTLGRQTIYVLRRKPN